MSTLNVPRDDTERAITETIRTYWVLVMVAAVGRSMVHVARQATR